MKEIKRGLAMDNALLRIPSEEEINATIDKMNQMVLQLQQFNKMVNPLRKIYKNPEDVSPENYVDVICAALLIPKEKMLARSRKRKIAFGRHIISWFLYRDFYQTNKYTMAQLASVLYHERTAIHHSNKVANDLIDTKHGEFMQYFHIANEAINSFLLNHKQKQQ